jgi:hypothetical protein
MPGIHQAACHSAHGQDARATPAGSAARLVGTLALQASRLRVKQPSSAFTLTVASHCVVATKRLTRDQRPNPKSKITILKFSPPPRAPRNTHELQVLFRRFGDEAVERMLVGQRWVRAARRG